MNYWFYKIRNIVSILRRNIFRILIIRVGIAIVFIGSLITLLLYCVEKSNNPSAYGSYCKTLRSITVLFLSGFDISEPQSTLGWLCALLMLCFGLTFVAVATGEVASWLVAVKIGGTKVGNVKLTNHIIVCTWSEVAKDIISQLLSEDIQEPKHIVIIDDKTAESPYDDPYVYFIPGDPAVASTLEKANAKQASTAIILADRSLKDPNLQDSKTTLVALAVESINPDIYTVVELMRAENIHHLKRVNADEIICINDMSRGLLAQTAINHGLSRFFMDILTFGQGSEIYKQSIKRDLQGRTFSDVVAELAKLRIIMISVERNGTIYTNPEPNYILQENDIIFALAEEESALINALSSIM